MEKVAYLLLKLPNAVFGVSRLGTRAPLFSPH